MAVAKSWSAIAFETLLVILTASIRDVFSTLFSRIVIRGEGESGFASSTARTASVP